MISGHDVIPSHNILFITLDSLRFDTARFVLRADRSPNLARILPGGNWEERRTPGTYTLPAHMSFFAGWLPTPARPGRPPRLLACRSPNGATIGERTYVFDAPDIVSGLAGLGYRTVCIGGVEFFSRLTPLGSVLPALFQESHWHHRMSADEPDSTRHQVDVALQILDGHPKDQRLLLFLNVSATHMPTHFYLPGQSQDSWESQCAALAYADAELGRLFDALPPLGPWFGLICADHGEAYGEDGWTGHSISHPTVWAVPYAETIIPAAAR
ncbi:STM4013/SEN3800 family hydrolase [Streptosporangium sp. NPDC001559]|uniref:STM4013/SEN3800 family hydrolase n=1 Tax=Streptosporangium sp. NPDC001559 TaxID=3366187 RepID=UPI0036EA0E3D